MTSPNFALRFPDLLAGLRVAYAQPDRAYHNWVHLQALLGHFRRLRGHWKNPEAVELIYFHDCIYDPMSESNESDSACRMADELVGLIDPAVVTDAQVLILATQHHEVPRDIRHGLKADCELFLDLDLSILGAAPEIFAVYAKAIRQEYAAVPDQIFNAGRKAVLHSFLQRPAIYFSQTFRDSHEAGARVNLAWAISQIGEVDSG